MALAVDAGDVLLTFAEIAVAFAPYLVGLLLLLFGASANFVRLVWVAIVPAPDEPPTEAAST